MKSACKRATLSFAHRAFLCVQDVLFTPRCPFSAPEQQLPGRDEALVERSSGGGQLGQRHGAGTSLAC